MTAATLDAPVAKRFFEGAFTPPVGYRPSSLRDSQVTAEEVLSRGVDPSDWSFPVVVSTPKIDRSGDSVMPEGCDYTAFSNNCSIYFDHQSIKFPVGTMRSPQDKRVYFAVEPGKGILGRIWIYKPAEDDDTEHADVCRTVWRLVEAELLNGLSVGFDPSGPVKSLRGGGNRYDAWQVLEVSIVPIPCNEEALVIRDPARLPSSFFKSLHPMIRKSLSARYPRETIFHPEGESMTTAIAKSEQGNTRDIKFEGGKWHLLDDKTRKTLSVHDTREEALGALRAIEMHKHGKSTVPEEQKDMDESSGADGGYTVPEKEKSIRAEIVKRMDDNECKGHYAYFHPASGEMRHVHPAGLAPEKVKSIAGDLHDVPGVKSLTQTAEHPAADEGFHKVYPQVAKSCGQENRVRKHKQMSAIGKALYRMIQKGQLNGWICTALEKRVCKSIMPRLLQCEMPEERAIKIAWGIAGVQKGLLPLIQKAMDDEEPDDDEDDTADDAENAVDDAATDAAMDMPGDEAAGQPDGLELVQTAIENLEAAIPRLEPERREFWQHIIEEIRDHGEETYPDEDFGGADDKGKEGAEAGDEDDAKEDEENDKILARYKHWVAKQTKAGRAARVKHISIVKVKKSLQKDPMAADTIRKAANHLHDIGDLHGEFDEKKGHCILKGYTAGHHRACRKMARDLDRVHGAITKGEEKPAPKEEEVKPAASGDEDYSDLGPTLKSLESRVGGLYSTVDSLHLRKTGRHLAG